MKINFTAFLCSFAVMLSCSLSCADSNRSLFLTTDEVQEKQIKECSQTADGFTFRTLKECPNTDPSLYDNIVIPYEEATVNSDLLKQAYDKGVRIYLYGSFTLKDYETVLGIPEFGTRILVRSNSEDAEVKAMFQGFTSDQKKKTVNVAAMSKDGSAQKAYFAIFDRTGNERNNRVRRTRIEPETNNRDRWIRIELDTNNRDRWNAAETGSHIKYAIPSEYYFTAVLDDLNLGNTEAIVEQGINSGTNTNVYDLETGSRLAMNYALWQDMSERDPDADYYTIVQNVSGASSQKGAYISETDARQSLVYRGDTMYESCPLPINGIHSNRSAIGLPDSSTPLSMSTKFGDIQCFPNMGSGEFRWALLSTGLGMHHLDNEVLKTGTTWAARNGEVAINLSMRSTTRWNSGCQLSHWETVGVIYR